jgi:hypothetical protein
MREFYKKCWFRAWRGKLFFVQRISGLLSIIAIPIGTWWKPSNIAALNWLPLMIFVSVFMAIVLWNFVTAPYYIATDLSQRF